MSIARRLNGRSIEAPIAGAMAFCAGFALAAAPAEAGMPGLTGADRPDDVIQARQWLMAGVESEMLAIDMADGGRKFEFSDLQSRAYMISTLLTAFPHLFPPETNPSPWRTAHQARPRRHRRSGKISMNFYGRVQEAAAIAFDASQAADFVRFLEPAKPLGAACDSCQAQYMQVR